MEHRARVSPFWAWQLEIDLRVSGLGPGVRLSIIRSRYRDSTYRGFLELHVIRTYCRGGGGEAAMPGLGLHLPGQVPAVAHLSATAEPLSADQS